MALKHFLKITPSGIGHLHGERKGSSRRLLPGVIRSSLARAHRHLLSFIAIAVVFTSCISMGEGKSLPPIETADLVRLKSDALGEHVISDTETIDTILAFANSYPDGWGVPWYGPPVPRLSFAFYSGSKFVGNFGLSEGFISRGLLNMESQFIEGEKTYRFAEDTHPAIFESVFLTLPEGDGADALLDQWEARLSELEPGTPWPAVEAFLEAHDIRTSYTSPTGYYRNLVLQIVHEGAYVDTAITAQLRLNPDLSIEEVRFFGYRHSMRDKS